LVELRRGSRTGARVTRPGPEAVARAAALQLQLGGATLSDVYVARGVIEPPAARMLAASGDDERYAALEAAYEEVQVGIDRFAVASAEFHVRLVELSGNQTLAIMAGSLYEIILRQNQRSVRRTKAVIPEAEAEKRYGRAVRSYAKLVRLVRAGSGDEAEAFWRTHLETTGPALLEGQEAARVIDVLE
jgi:DNA-binding FadR family transcriptional regulator